jgi:hypothetical protein
MPVATIAAGLLGTLIAVFPSVTDFPIMEAPLKRRQTV